jgi:hypothetical protein
MLPALEKRSMHFGLGGVGAGRGGEQVKMTVFTS